MNRIFMATLLSTFMCMQSVGAYAEVYRWTDANGKVHYGDKKPKAAAEDITEKVNQVNVDTSTEEHQKLETLFRKENDADREYQQQQARPDSNQIIKCKEAREYLRVINGRVQFIDKDGKMVRVTEEERQQKVKDVQTQIKRNCPN